MRQEPPFNMHYITYTHILEHLPKSVRVINNPASVRNAPEKLLVTSFKDLMPETIISSDVDVVLKFQEIHKDIVLKPLYGKGGEKSKNLNFNKIIDYSPNYIFIMPCGYSVEKTLNENLTASHLKFGPSSISLPSTCLNLYPFASAKCPNFL